MNKQNEETITITEECANCFALKIDNLYRDHPLDMSNNDHIKLAAYVLEKCREQCGQSTHNPVSFVEFIRILRRKSPRFVCDVDEKLRYL